MSRVFTLSKKNHRNYRKNKNETSYMSAAYKRSKTVLVMEWLHQYTEEEC